MTKLNHPARETFKKSYDVMNLNEKSKQTLFYEVKDIVSSATIPNEKEKFNTFLESKFETNGSHIYKNIHVTYDAKTKVPIAMYVSHIRKLVIDGETIYDCNPFGSVFCKPEYRGMSFILSPSYSDLFVKRFSMIQHLKGYKIVWCEPVRNPITYYAVTKNYQDYMEAYPHPNGNSERNRKLYQALRADHCANDIHFNVPNSDTLVYSPSLPKVNFKMNEKRHNRYTQYFQEINPKWADQHCVFGVLFLNKVPDIYKSMVPSLNMQSPSKFYKSMVPSLMRRGKKETRRSML